MTCAQRNTRIHCIYDITVLILVIIMSGYKAGAKEYCITESFNPYCIRENTVIVMSHAKYGRMDNNRCVTSAYGNVGCSKNVINFIDSLCSGRRSCDVSISHPALVRTQPCTMDFSSYLDASYVCEEIVQIPRDACKHDGRHHITQPHGFISPLTTNTRVRHEKRCPLVIRAEPGQKISFTLYDFALRNDTMQKFTTEQFCQQYLIIREPMVGSDLTICSGEEREREVYISRGQEVTLELTMRSDVPSFLLRYQVVGCPRIKNPEGTFTKYNEDIVNVICNNSRDSFALMCVNNTWVGEFKNCTSPGNFVSNGFPGTGGGSSLISLPPIGISIVIILGVAMVIVVYVAVMIVCVLYIKKKRRRRHCNEREVQMMVPEPDRSKMMDKGSDLQPEERLPMLTKTSLMCSSSSDCLETCELHEMKPCTMCNNCSTYMTSQAVAMAREESAYGPGRAATMMGPNAQSHKQSPLKQSAENTPRGVRTVSSPAVQGQSIPYHPQVRGIRPITVVDSRLFSEGPYGFPPSYFKTFSQPATNPAPTNPGAGGGETSVTSPDIVPEYASQNSTNAALAVAGQTKDRDSTVLQNAEELS